MCAVLASINFESAPTLTRASTEAAGNGSVAAMLLEGSDGLLWGMLLDSAASSRLTVSSKPAVEKKTKGTSSPVDFKASV